MIILAWSSAALLTGFILDTLFGDPYWFPHIVRWMGNLITALEKVLRRAKNERLGGFILVLLVTLICTGATSDCAKSLKTIEKQDKIWYNEEKQR